MRKVVILTLVTLFTCVEYSQAQTTETVSYTHLTLPTIRLV